MKPQIFLSYSYQDKTWVSEFAHALQEQGVNIWFDAEQIALGDKLQDRLENALRGSNVLVVILSKNSVQSRWMYFEIGAALADNKKIIPIVVDDVGHEQLPPLLTRYQYLREQSPVEASKVVAKLFEEPGVATT
jgi:hypothetical protein